MLQPEQINSIRSRLVTNQTQPNIASVVAAIRDEVPILSTLELIDSTESVIAQTTGFGPIEKLISTPGVTDVLVNRFDEVWFDQGDGLVKAQCCWKSETELREFAARLVASVNRRLDDVSPFVDAQLATGIRFHAVIPPISTNGTALSFRLPAVKDLNLVELIENHTIDSGIADLLKQIIARHISFAISGSTGSGKTTILGALLSEVDKSERIVIIEDSSELKVNHPHVVNLQTRNANTEGIGSIELKQLVRQALRMRPDRIVIGEIRGSEVLDLLIALNTGHQGGCVTVHANNTQSVIARIEALGLLAKIPKIAIHALLKEAIQVFLHVTKTESGRRLSEISVLDVNDQNVLTVYPALDLLTKKSFEPGWQKLQQLLQK